MCFPGIGLGGKGLRGPHEIGSKRSIVIDAHKTSVSLEDAFWHDLKSIAYVQRATLSELVAKIDQTRKKGNLSSAIRLYVLEFFRNGKQPNGRG
jgi:predicted DNA-binding ribbon-helix-helix protein